MTQKITESEASQFVTLFTTHTHRRTGTRTVTHTDAQSYTQANSLSLTHTHRRTARTTSRLRITTNRPVADVSTRIPVRYGARRVTAIVQSACLSTDALATMLSAL